MKYFLSGDNVYYYEDDDDDQDLNLGRRRRKKKRRRRKKKKRKKLFRKGFFKRAVSRVKKAVKKVSRSPVFKKIVKVAAVVGAAALGGVVAAKVVKKVKGLKALKKLKEAQAKKEDIEKAAQETYDKLGPPKQDINNAPPEDVAAKVKVMDDARKTKTIPEQIATGRTLGFTAKQTSDMIATGKMDVGGNTYDTNKPAPSERPRTAWDEPPPEPKPIPATEKWPPSPPPPAVQPITIPETGEQRPLYRLLDPKDFQLGFWKRKSAAEKKAEDELKRKKAILKKNIKTLGKNIRFLEKKYKKFRRRVKKAPAYRPVLSKIQLEITTANSNYKKLKSDLRSVGRLKSGSEDGGLGALPAVVVTVGAMAAGTLITKYITETVKEHKRVAAANRLLDKLERGEISPGQYLRAVTGTGAAVKPGQPSRRRLDLPGIAVKILPVASLAIASMVIWKAVKGKFRRRRKK